MALRRADDNAYTLATAASATGNSVAIRGGEYLLSVEFAGTATVALQVQSPNGTWLTVNVFNASPVSFSASGMQTAIDLPAGNARAAVTTGSVTASTLYAYLIGLG